MGARFPRKSLLAWSVGAALCVLLSCTAAAEELPRAPFGGPTSFIPASGAPLRAGPAGIHGMLASGPSPSGPSSQHGALTFSGSMLRGILPGLENLQLGYLWSLAETYRQGVFTADCTFPVRPSPGHVLFGELHGRWENPLRTGGSSNDSAVQVLLGGGYRKKVSPNRMAGINAFYNTVRLQQQWLSSGIIGLEMNEVSHGGSILSLKLNYYGNVLQGRWGLFGAWAEGRGDYKCEASYSLPRALGVADVRAKIVGYRLDRHKPGYGWNVGADFSTINRLLVLRYEYGYDTFSLTYHNIHAQVSLTFHSDRLISGRNPLALPNP